MKKTNVRIPLPRVAQKYEYDCGAAALKSLYEFENPNDINPIQKYIKLLGSSKDHGTNTRQLATAVKLLGLKMVEYKNMSLKRLEKEISTGNPVLCLIRSNDHGHFVIAIGFDDTNIFFEDPWKKRFNGFLPKKEFFERWTDGDVTQKNNLIRFGMVIKSGYQGHGKVVTSSRVTGN
jgi:predicted double-glycine peptidase